MSKSIFEILDDVTTETSVPSQGKTEDGKAIVIAHTIPRDLFPTSAQFEDEDDLFQWAEESGFAHAMLQRGIQKFLIETRAAFKGCKKDDEWSPEYGQANVDAMEWNVVKRPNQGKNNEAIAKAVLAETITTMQLMIDAAGLDEEKIEAVLNEKFNSEADIVDSILGSLKF